LLLHKQDGVRKSDHASIGYTERLAEAGIELWVGSVGDIPSAEARQRSFALLDVARLTA